MLSAVQSIGEEEWTQTHEMFKYICRKMEVKKAGRRIAGLGKVAWDDGRRRNRCSHEQKVGTAGVSLLEAWNVDIHNHRV